MQPLINKIGGALATAIVSLTLIWTHIKLDGTTADAIGATDQLIFKIAMFVIPLAMIVAGYIIYRKKYKIDETFYSQILQELDLS